MEKGSRRLTEIIYGLFLLSGATALAYEVIWARMLVRVFGATAFAVSAVLAAYMAGLALGSYLFGRIVDRKGNPILVYGFLELGIGVFALAFPVLLPPLNRAFGGLFAGLEGKTYALSVMRFVLSFFMLLVPTTLMGGTLPVLSRFLTSDLSHLTARVGRLYSINTLGAVIGASSTGFVLLPHLGMKNTTFATVACNMGIFLVSLALAARRTPVELRGEEPAVALSASQEATSSGASVGLDATPRDKTASSESSVLIAFLLTGMAGLCAEVIWTRALALVVGTTVYAFAIMLTTFLLGLALGSAVFARIGQRTARPRAMLGWLVIAIGFAVLLSAAGFTRLPVLYMMAYESTQAAWGNFFLLPLLLSLLVMIIPTFMMGATFPLVARIYATDLSRVGAQIGTAYAFNTVGSIVGSFLGAFVLLNFLGVKGSMFVVSVTYILAGALVLAATARRGAWRGIAAKMSLVGAAAVITALLIPGWNKVMMTSGVYTYAPFFGTADRLREQVRSTRMLFYDDGPGATVSVERSANALSLKIDGKVDASTGPDMATQELLLHLPFLFHPDPDTALVIGLGSGVSLGSAATYDASRLECAELIGSVVRASDFFRADNFDVLSDPRVHLVLDDGRNVLFFTDKKYDIIGSEPTNPWISGVGDLFTTEFFQAAARHLKPGGIMSSWLQLYQMSDEEFRAEINTFASVFPYASLWVVNKGDVVLLGSFSPLAINRSFVERMKEPHVQADLARAGVHEPSDVLSMLWLGDGDLRSFARKVGKKNTDDNMLLEFGTGRRLVESTLGIHMSSLIQNLVPRVFAEMDSSTNAQTRIQAVAKRTAMMGLKLEVDGNLGEAMRFYDEAHYYAPTDPFVAGRYADGYLQTGISTLKNGQYDAAIGQLMKALAGGNLGESWKAYHGLGLCYYFKREYEPARETLVRSVELNPDNAAGYVYLGLTAMATGDTLGAVAYHEKAFETRPWDPEVAFTLARTYATTGSNWQRAMELARKASRGRNDPEYYDTIGLVYLKRGDLSKAESSLSKALRIDPGHAGAVYHLAVLKHAEGKDDEARALVAQVLRMAPGGQYAADADNLAREMERK